MYVTDEQNTKVQIIHAILVARLAQSVEHETLNLRVVGSSSTLGDQTFLKFSHPVKRKPNTFDI